MQLFGREPTATHPAPKRTHKLDRSVSETETGAFMKPGGYFDRERRGPGLGPHWESVFDS